VANSNTLTFTAGQTSKTVTVKVNGVLGHYGIPLVDPISWDVSLEISPTAVDRLLQNVTGAVFGAVFNGDPTDPSVEVHSALVLNFSFGFDATLSSFYVAIDSLTAKAEVDVTGLTGFDLDMSIASKEVTDGFVNLAACTAICGAARLLRLVGSQTNLSSALIRNIELDELL
jgi:hypothetical protein